VKNSVTHVDDGAVLERFQPDINTGRSQLRTSPPNQVSVCVWGGGSLNTTEFQRVVYTDDGDANGHVYISIERASISQAR
jgi:hypothetical protein